MPDLVTDDGTRLHYTDTGGSGRPLVLVHGWPLSGEAFAGNVPPKFHTPAAISIGRSTGWPPAPGRPGP